MLPTPLCTWQNMPGRPVRSLLQVSRLPNSHPGPARRKRLAHLPILAIFSFGMHLAFRRADSNTGICRYRLSGPNCISSSLQLANADEEVDSRLRDDSRLHSG